MIGAHERKRLQAQYETDPASVGTLVLRSVIGLVLVAGVALIGAHAEDAMQETAVQAKVPMQVKEAMLDTSSSVRHIPVRALASRETHER